METTQERTTTGVRAEGVSAVLIGAYIVYALVVGIETTGRHLLELGMMRFVLLAALLAFARQSGALSSRLGRIARSVTGAAAVTFVAGAVGAVVNDGWTRNIFGPGDAAPPWYAYVIGLSGIVFAIGTAGVGIAGRSAGRVAALVIVAGITFPLALAGQGAGHIGWLAVWLVLCIALIRARPTSPSRHREAALAA